MKTLHEFDGLKVPSYALSYLVNSDSTGLDDSDIEIIDNWYNGYLEIAKKDNAQVIFSIIEEDYNYSEPYFAHNPAFGLAGDVNDCTILIVK